MTTLTGAFRRRFLGRSAERAPSGLGEEERLEAPDQDIAPIDIAPNDPLLAYLQSASGAVDVESLELRSPALAAMKDAGVKLAVPLVSQGELIGVLNLGPRRSEQEYSTDDRKLLDNLAAQAAPALRVGQLVREQQAEAATRQRFEQELEVARLIQQNFLPKQLPDLADWQVAAYYRPAREVGGDFYDVIPLSDGRIGFVIGDVTDKGVPAALVMAATRSVLRASAQRIIEPGEVLERVNEHLCPDMPEKMFVTCLYGVLDPAHGQLPVRQRRPRPALREDGGGLRRAARARHAARADDRHGLRGERGRARPRRVAAAALRRRRRGPRPGRQHVRLPAAQGGCRALPRRPRAHRPRARPTSRSTPGPMPSRRTTSRW